MGEVVAEPGKRLVWVWLAARFELRAQPAERDAGPAARQVLLASRARASLRQAGVLAHRDELRRPSRGVTFSASGRGKEPDPQRLFVRLRVRERGVSVAIGREPLRDIQRGMGVEMHPAELTQRQRVAGQIGRASCRERVLTGV